MNLSGLTAENVWTINFTIFFWTIANFVQTCDDIEDIPMVGKAGNPVKPPTPENAEIKEIYINCLAICYCMQYVYFQSGS